MFQENTTQKATEGYKILPDLQLPLEIKEEIKKELEKVDKIKPGISQELYKCAQNNYFSCFPDLEIIVFSMRLKNFFKFYQNEPEFITKIITQTSPGVFYEFVRKNKTLFRQDIEELLQADNFFIAIQTFLNLEKNTEYDSQRDFQHEIIDLLFSKFKDKAQKQREFVFRLFREADPEEANRLEKLFDIGYITQRDIRDLVNSLGVIFVFRGTGVITKVINTYTEMRDKIIFFQELTELILEGNDKKNDKVFDLIERSSLDFLEDVIQGYIHIEQYLKDNSILNSTEDKRFFYDKDDSDYMINPYFHFYLPQSIDEGASFDFRQAILNQDENLMLSVMQKAFQDKKLNEEEKKIAQEAFQEVCHTLQRLTQLQQARSIDEIEADQSENKLEKIILPQSARKFKVLHIEQFKKYQDKAKKYQQRITSLEARLIDIDFDDPEYQEIEKQIQDLEKSLKIKFHEIRVPEFQKVLIWKMSNLALGLMIRQIESNDRPINISHILESFYYEAFIIYNKVHFKIIPAIKDFLEYVGKNIPLPDLYHQQDIKQEDIPDKTLDYIPRGAWHIGRDTQNTSYIAHLASNFGHMPYPEIKKAIIHIKSSRPMESQVDHDPETKKLFLQMLKDLRVSLDMIGIDGGYRGSGLRRVLQWMRDNQEDFKGQLGDEFVDSIENRIRLFFSIEDYKYLRFYHDQNIDFQKENKYEQSVVAMEELPKYTERFNDIAKASKKSGIDYIIQTANRSEGERILAWVVQHAVWREVIPRTKEYSLLPEGQKQDIITKSIEKYDEKYRKTKKTYHDFIKKWKAQINNELDV